MRRVADGRVMAALLDIGVPAISKHLTNIFEPGELKEEATISKKETVQQDGRGGASDESMISEGSRALRIFALSFIPFCYIYVLMIVYKLYCHHRMALFISFALSLTVIPVMWVISEWAPQLLWYSYLIAYLIEVLLIFAVHRWLRLRFTIS